MTRRRTLDRFDRIRLRKNIVAHIHTRYIREECRLLIPVRSKEGLQMLNPITLPFANQLVEDRLEVRRWLETLPVSPPERVIQELQKRRVKDQIGTRTETMLAVVDEFFFVVKTRLERSPADALLDEDGTISDALQEIESSFLALYDYFDDDGIRAEYGIRWTNALIKRFHVYAEKANDLIWKIDMHDGTIAADSVEDKTPLNAAEIISELGLDHARNE